MNMPGYLEIVDYDLPSAQAGPASSTWPRYTYRYDAVCRACGAVILSWYWDGLYQHQLDCSRHQGRRLLEQWDYSSSEEWLDYSGLPSAPLETAMPRGKRRRLNPKEMTPPPDSHAKTGRGEDLLTTHLEPNPGPADHTEPHPGRSSARGASLLSCGDVEPNPGPPKAKARKTEAMAIDLAVPPSDPVDLIPPPASNRSTPEPQPESTPPVSSQAPVASQTDPVPAESRWAQQWVFPFTGCPQSRQHLSRDSFTKHLCRVHVSADEGLPQNILDSLGYQVCTLHRTMHKIS